MSLTPATTDGFRRGLNLRDKADAVSDDEAIDCLNTEFTERGTIKQRAGWTAFTSGALTNRAASLEPFYTTGGTKQLLAGCGTRLEALNTSGAIVASVTGATDGTWDFARFGAPGSELAYAGQGNDTLRKWDGSAWSSVANTPKAGALAVMAVETGNRMVATRFKTTTGGPTGGAATSNPSRTYLSDPGDPETWPANNFIDFTPGDGEEVQAALAWREFTFIFKESKFFVIYGSSEDADGNPIFHYRTVDTGIGLASPRAVASDETGVYFMDRLGVFRTTGGDPEHLSQIVEPIWYGGASDYYQGGILAHSAITNCAMGIHEDRVYVGFPTATTNDRALVYDTHADWWSLFDFPAAAFASFRIGSQAELVFARATGDNHVDRHNSTLTNDNGSATVARWRGGWHGFGTTEVKVIRESKVWGAGKCFMAVTGDYNPDPGNLVELDFTDPTADTWGGTTWGGGTWADTRALRPAFRNRSEEGTVFSTYFENRQLDVNFAVSRLSHHLREQRIPSVA